MISRLSTHTKPIFHSIHIHTYFFNLFLIVEDFSSRCCRISWNRIINTHDLEWFPLSSCSIQNQLWWNNNHTLILRRRYDTMVPFSVPGDGSLDVFVQASSNFANSWRVFLKSFDFDFDWIDSSSVHHGSKLGESTGTVLSSLWCWCSPCYIGSVNNRPRNAVLLIRDIWDDPK